MANVTEDGNFTSAQNQTSTPIWHTGVFAFLSALNIFLSITASLGNALILVALYKETSMYPPTKLFFRCLAITEFSVGLISQPLFSVYLTSSITTGMNSNIEQYISAVNGLSSFTLCEVSVFTSTAISVDRFLALLKGLRYKHVVTLRRVRAVINCFWFIECIDVLLEHKDCHNCRRYPYDIFLATSVVFFTKIYLKLQHHQLQVQVPEGRYARYKKSVSSVLWVQIVLVSCYVPFIVAVMMEIYGRMFGNKLHIVFRLI